MEDTTSSQQSVSETDTIPVDVCEAVAAPAAPTVLCSICFSNDSRIVTNLCGEDCSSPFCSDCLSTYFTGIVDAGYYGACPKVRCPSPDCSGRVVSQSKWTPLVSQETVTTFTTRASSVVTFQCSSCHARRSLLKNDILPDLSSSLQLLTKNAKLEHLLPMVEGYIAGEVHQNDLVDAVKSIANPNGVPHNVALEKEEIIAEMKELMDGVFEAVNDLERRATLQSRYMAVFPKFKTPCCKAVHCYKCRTKSFHAGRSCEAVSAARSTDAVLQCPNCSIHIVKGDGCSSITCVCGTSFNWSTLLEHRTQTMSDAFSTRHSDHAAGECLAVLNHYVEVTAADTAEATAYQTRNAAPIDHYRGKLWEATHAVDAAPAAVYWAARAVNQESKRMATHWLSCNPWAIQVVTQRKRLGSAVAFAAFVGRTGADIADVALYLEELSPDLKREGQRLVAQRALDAGEEESKCETEQQESKEGEVVYERSSNGSGSEAKVASGRGRGRLSFRAAVRKTMVVNAVINAFKGLGGGGGAPAAPLVNSSATSSSDITMPSTAAVSLTPTGGDGVAAATAGTDSTDQSAEETFKSQLLRTLCVALDEVDGSFGPGGIDMVVARCKAWQPGNSISLAAARERRQLRLASDWEKLFATEGDRAMECARVVMKCQPHGRLEMAMAYESAHKAEVKQARVFLSYIARTFAALPEGIRVEFATRALEQNCTTDDMSLIWTRRQAGVCAAVWLAAHGRDKLRAAVAARLQLHTWATAFCDSSPADMAAADYYLQRMREMGRSVGVLGCDCRPRHTVHCPRARQSAPGTMGALPTLPPPPKEATVMQASRTPTATSTSSSASNASKPSLTRLPSHLLGRIGRMLNGTSSGSALHVAAATPTIALTAPVAAAAPAVAVSRTVAVVPVAVEQAAMDNDRSRLSVQIREERLRRFGRVQTPSRSSTTQTRDEAEAAERAALDAAQARVAHGERELYVAQQEAARVALENSGADPPRRSANRTREPRVRRSARTDDFLNSIRHTPVVLRSTGERTQNSSSSSASAAILWPCLACTFLNQGSTRRCAMCSTPRPVAAPPCTSSTSTSTQSTRRELTSSPMAAAPAPPAPVEPVHWNCVRCTFMNRPMLQACEMCLSAREAVQEGGGIGSQQHTQVDGQRGDALLQQRVERELVRADREMRTRERAELRGALRARMANVPAAAPAPAAPPAPPTPVELSNWDREMRYRARTELLRAAQRRLEAREGGSVAAARRGAEGASQTQRQAVQLRAAMLERRQAQEEPRVVSRSAPAVRVHLSPALLERHAALGDESRSLQAQELRAALINQLQELDDGTAGTASSSGDDSFPAQPPRFVRQLS